MTSAGQSEGRVAIVTSRDGRVHSRAGNAPSLPTLRFIPIWDLLADFYGIFDMPVSVKVFIDNLSW